MSVQRGIVGMADYDCVSEFRGDRMGTTVVVIYLILDIIHA